MPYSISLVFFFRIIKLPMKPKLSHKITFVIICLIYLLSIGSTLPFTFMIRVSNYGHITSYSVEYDAYVRSSWTFNIIVFWTTILIVTTLVPTTILTAVYYSAAMAIIKSLEATQCSTQSKKRIMRNRKVNRMFVIAVVCFFISVTPYTIFCVLFALLTEYQRSFILSNRNLLNWVDLVLQTIMTFNSCINPFVYCKMHKEVASFINKKIRSLKKIRPR